MLRKEQLYKKISDILNVDFKILSRFLDERLGFLVEDNYQFILEEYTDAKWKEILSLAYINTSYIQRVGINPTKALRVHVFRDENYCEENYLGCFILRPVDEEYICLSSIYPNFKNISLKSLDLKDDEKAFIMGYFKKVHIFGEEFEIFTYPFYQQDSIVTVCAHADILMMGEYLFANNFIKELPSVEKIVFSFSSARTKLIPSRGLYMTQMLEICSNIGIPVKFEYLKILKQRKRDEYYIDFKKNCEPLIHSLIDSGLPVIVGVNGHVFLLIGHTLKDGKRNYIIYDDSGAFIKKYKGKPYFLSTIDILEKEIVDEIEFIIYPEPEKFYII